jgi:hypothetical protein
MSRFGLNAHTSTGVVRHQSRILSVRYNGVTFAELSGAHPRIDAQLKRGAEAAGYPLTQTAQLQRMGDHDG